MLLTREVYTSIWVCSVSHLYVHYSPNDNVMVVKTLLRWENSSMMIDCCWLGLATCSKQGQDVKGIMGFVITPT